MKPAVHQYEDKLLEFAYGELTGPEASAVEAHVEGCARCTQALSEIRSVRMTMGKLPQATAPDAGLESLFAYAEQAARRNAAGPAGAPTWWRRLVAPLAGAMALGLLAVVGVKVSEESKGELMPMPSKVAVEKAEAYDRRAPAEELAQAPAAPTPAPVVAAEPAPERAGGQGDADRELQLEEQKQRKDAPAKPAPKKKAMGKDSFDEAFGGEREPSQDNVQAYGATNALGATPAPEKKADLGDNLEKAAKLSQKRRAEAKPADKAAEPDDLAAGLGSTRGGNLGNVGSKPAAAAPPAPPAQVAQSAPSTSSKGSFGLTTGGAGSGRAQTADIDEAESVVAPTGKSVSGGVPAPAPRTQSLERSRDAAPQREEAAKQEKEKSASPKEIDRLLADARAQHSRNNLTQEIALAQQALNVGATGNQRAEALARICDAFDALGRESQADPYCQALLIEFRNTAVAQRVAQRRGSPSMNPQPSADVKRAKKSSAPAEADAAKEVPAKKNAASEAAY